MPKAFSQSEKRIISENLLTIGRKHFEKFGIRGTRVDDICREVGISKGSFYVFFPSKELLFMSIADANDVRYKSAVLDFLTNANGAPNDIAARFFDYVVEKIETDPILKIVRDPGDFSSLLRKLPPDTLLENERRDREFSVEIASIFKNRHKISFADAQTLEDFTTLLASFSMQSDFISVAGNLGSTTALMRDLFVTRLLKGPLND